MKRRSFIYMSFGRESSYRQALFSIFTLLGSGSSVTTVYVVTDKPAFFIEFLGEHPLIQYIVIDAGDIREMRGPIDFIHRMKIASIEKVWHADPETDQFVYIDSDTFVLGNLDGVTDLISSTDSLMHVHEFTFASVAGEADSNPTRPILADLRVGNICFRRGDVMVTADDDFSSWNAGVLGIHVSNMALLPSVYALTDAIFTRHNHHAAEQFAFSYMLERHTRVHTCDAVIYHYWPAVKKEIAELFFCSLFDSRFLKLSFAERVTRVMDARPVLAGQLAQHYLALKHKAVLFLNDDQWRSGYYWAMRAVMRRPVGDFRFILDILYHTRRMLGGVIWSRKKTKIQSA